MGAPWHPGHIAERYGLFTLIVLGEPVLATGLVLAALVAAAVIARCFEPAPAPETLRSGA